MEGNGMKKTLRMINDWLIAYNLNPNWDRVEFHVGYWFDTSIHEHNRTKERRRYVVRKVNT